MEIYRHFRAVMMISVALVALTISGYIVFNRYAGSSVYKIVLPNGWSNYNGLRPAVDDAHLPIVVNTWPFTNATDGAFNELMRASSSDAVLNAIEVGCNICEIQQCDFTVGYGGSPDSVGETTLDAMIMSGRNQNMGAVAFLRRVKDAIKVARAVLEHTDHSILVGEGATSFAKMLGFKEQSLTTKRSLNQFTEWKEANCQPNYYKQFENVRSSCPPYHLTPARGDGVHRDRSELPIDVSSHDTIGMVVMDAAQRMAAGTSSNGANHKVEGRVGDAPIPGAGAYVMDGSGAAAATGDGDVMMRFLPSFHAVQLMGQGYSPTAACEAALAPIIRAYPSFKGAIVCLNSHGEHGAGSHGWKFSYSVRRKGWKETKVVSVEPINNSRVSAASQ